MVSLSNHEGPVAAFSPPWFDKLTMRGEKERV